MNIVVLLPWWMVVVFVPVALCFRLVAWTFRVVLRAALQSLSFCIGRARASSMRGGPWQ